MLAKEDNRITNNAGRSAINQVRTTRAIAFAKVNLISYIHTCSSTYSHIHMDCQPGMDCNLPGEVEKGGKTSRRPPAPLQILQPYSHTYARLPTCSFEVMSHVLTHALPYWSLSVISPIDLPTLLDGRGRVHGARCHKQLL